MPAAPFVSALALVWTMQQLASLLRLMAEASAHPCCCPPATKEEIACAVPEEREPRESGDGGRDGGDCGNDGGCGGSDAGGGGCSL